MILGCLKISLSPCRKDFIALTNPRKPSNKLIHNSKILVNYPHWISMAIEVSTIILPLFKFSTSHQINVFISRTSSHNVFLQLSTLAQLVPEMPWKQLFFTHTNISLNTIFTAWTTGWATESAIKLVSNELHTSGTSSWGQWPAGLTS